MVGGKDWGASGHGGSAEGKTSGTLGIGGLEPSEGLDGKTSDVGLAEFVESKDSIGGEYVLGKEVGKTKGSKFRSTVEGTVAKGNMRSSKMTFLLTNMIFVLKSKTL